MLCSDARADPYTLPLTKPSALGNLNVTLLASNPGPPIIGKTKYDNLHLNTGHGTLGWTMACGAGRVMTDLLLQRKADIATDELTLDRYR